MRNPVRKVRQVRRKITYIESESECNDSDKDKDFNPKELESSDSSDENDTIQELQQSKHNSPVYSTIKQIHSKSPENDEDEAKKRSLDIHYAAELRRKYHKKRLDNLLESNELVREPVYGDGDCFFTSVMRSLNCSYSVKQLRGKVCDHFLEHHDHYFDFLSFEDQMIPEEQQKAFMNEIEKMRALGYWQSMIGDLLPLAVANLFKCCVYVYTSNIQQPLKMIQPDIVQPVGTGIKLALTSIPGENHYDAVSNKNKDAYVCVMQQTDVTKAGLDVFTVLSPKQKATFTVQNDIQPASTQPLEEPSNEKSLTPTKDENSLDCNNNIPTPMKVTPHKSAEFYTPPKLIRTRKKKCNPKTWKRNIAKDRKRSGLEYTSCTGKTMNAKSVKPIDCSKCRFRCSDKMSEEDRKDIFSLYYGMSSYEHQRQFLCQMIDSENPKRCIGKKTVSRQFHFTIQEKRVRVCREFFLRTLDIGKKTIELSMSKKVLGAFSSTDKRGKQCSANTTPDEITNSVKEHIKSFPTMESHYCRKDSKKQYLSQDLNIRKMWMLYQHGRKSKNLPAVKEAKYREIFCNDFNLSFFKPKHDQCSLCSLYSTQKEPSEILAKRYQEHQVRKNIARNEKTKDKMKSKSDPSCYAATFDLQAVLTTPCGQTGELYYTRKLCVYNLSFYSLGDSEGVCHVWDETQGKRGSQEIATCILKNTGSVCASKPKTKEITYYSDKCSGQNRNQFVAGAYLYSMAKFPNLQEINHKFLESGHSHMECDSIHSAIETAKKKTSVFVPSQWNTVISMARRGKPYHVVPLKYMDVFNFKDFVQKFCPNLKTTTSGDKVNWMNICWIQTRRDYPLTLFVNETFDEAQFQEIKVQAATRKKGRPSILPDSLSPCYQARLTVSAAKKADLLNLCKKQIIPEDCHEYYKNLTTTHTKTDVIPAPATDEEEEDTDTE